MRKEPGVVRSTAQIFTQNRIMTEALNLAGVMILIINDARQIVYANRLMLDALQRDSVDEILGLRPGEAMNCAHAQDMPGGCGTGPACKDCSALNLILRSITTGVPQEDEVAIQRTGYGINSAINMKVKVVPYTLTGEICYILTLSDNTDTIRRRELERIFFHDILNSTGAIKNYLALLVDEFPESLKADVRFLDTALAETIEDIHAQKSLGDAENHDYQVHITAVSPYDMFQSIMRYFKFYQEREFKKMSLSVPEKTAVLFTDSRILRRVLINMVKNALEATDKDGEVRLCYEELTDQVHTSRFSVWNPGYIEPMVQSRIFNRSFSTKGFGRGLGTYSMKLFGEKYLGARVGFSSNEKEGTAFYILMPENVEGIT